MQAVIDMTFARLVSHRIVSDVMSSTGTGKVEIWETNPKVAMDATMFVERRAGV